MITTVIICALSVFGMLALALTEHRLHPKHASWRVFWMAPLAGAMLLILIGIITPADAIGGLLADSAVNPLKILVLFFAMTLMSVFLDELGFFRFLAMAVLARAGTNQKRLFLLLYAAVSILTVFTSNDIVVLTFTPFICYFAKHAKIDPLPYLFAEFVAANTWSMALMIGNPTNIYLATSAGVDFLGYLRVMLLPTLFAGGVSLLMLWLLFSRKLHAPMIPSVAKEHVKGKFSVGLALFSLGTCIFLMVISSYISLPMWLIAVGCCIFMYLSVISERILRHRTLSPVGASVLRAPFDVAPFVISMFLLVMCLARVGVTDALSRVLLGEGEILRTGVASFFAANLVNNIPMSVLFSSVVAPSGIVSMPAMYAAVIGSNVGAFFTPMGALAGIMWLTLLRQHDVKLSFGNFVAYGAMISIPTLLAALFGLAIVL